MRHTMSAAATTTDPSFGPKIALEEEGRTVCDRPLTVEKDLKHFDRLAVEEKVKMGVAAATVFGRGTRPPRWIHRRREQRTKG